ncbi:MAG: NAD(P)H-dependent oxidoreductase subunit E [Nitrospirae bacterium CG_4_10_14_3_um_filter_44_29]|nr:NAD(P)H-dependent oxidoreductase subunit E [Nitrospirota bacterium]OIO29369.1 MAG: NAD(P)H-dependent oxidoreductase subunit E [Nitrospirae bacterium CG1_02_44_142]PIP70608.1 MAG: NAD(P)H-dependent oxidoreductase subunit E [Nitrospirae bacterium CG22_combo_CG10-13_8_21_14_all_44_11]PIV41754.1 MAG: NAD(P)H-dependent oxidoreductase subunit E [Nitrospirae bacterium CG02_land_8_20_14_3_00_44_33]PIV66324.1 MAG: NAD(P)H-dependent oxidoreductase subunit E [Nitrospirae bacterium CG01_land_8_20_14_3_0
MEKTLEKIMKEEIENEGNLISILQNIEARFGYIPEDAVNWFSKRLDVPASRFYGVTTFYSQFHLKPRGRNIVTACCGTACHVKGSEKLISAAAMELNLKNDEDTTENGEITLERVACLGTCSMAPVVLINKKIHGKMTLEKLKKELKLLKKAAQ